MHYSLATSLITSHQKQSRFKVLLHNIIEKKVAKQQTWMRRWNNRNEVQGNNSVAIVSLAITKISCYNFNKKRTISTLIKLPLNHRNRSHRYSFVMDSIVRSRPIKMRPQGKHQLSNKNESWKSVHRCSEVRVTNLKT